MPLLTIVDSGPLEPLKFMDQKLKILWKISQKYKPMALLKDQSKELTCLMLGWHQFWTWWDVQL